MDRKLKLELDQALQDVRNAAVPLADDRVRDVIAGLQAIQRSIVEWGLKNNPRR